MDRPSAIVRPVEPAPTAAEVEEAADRAESDLDTAAVHPRLSEKVLKVLRWQDEPLARVFEYLRMITGVSFHLSDALAAGRGGEIRITTSELEEEGAAITVEDLLLEAICAPHHLRWEVRGGVVWILDDDDLSGPLRLRFYDVLDLVHDAEGGNSELGAQARMLVLPALRRRYAEYWKGGAELSEKDSTTPGLACRAGVLIVRASPVMLERIGAWLESMHRVWLTPALQEKVDGMRVSLSVDNSTVGEVIKILLMQTGMNLTIDPREPELAEDPVVGLDLPDVPLRTALLLVRMRAGEDAVWLGRGSVIMLTRAKHLAK